MDMLLRGFAINELEDGTSQILFGNQHRDHAQDARQIGAPGPEMRSKRRICATGSIRSLPRSRALDAAGGGRIHHHAIPLGETAFVGFGSAVVATSTNNAIQLKQNLAAQKIASMLLKDALCGLIIGDKTSWKCSVVESMNVQGRNFSPWIRTIRWPGKIPTAER